MTADVELLPLPSVLLNWPHPTNHVAIRDYARACVAHATAAKDAAIARWKEAAEWQGAVTKELLPYQDEAVSGRAEIEALRAEVERLTFEMGCLQQQYDERTAYMIVHRGSALVCSDAVRSAYSDEHHRAERLAEALRAARKMLAVVSNYFETEEPHPILQADVDEQIEAIDAAAQADEAASRPAAGGDFSSEVTP